jgi:hypothetical protein
MKRKAFTSILVTALLLTLLTATALAAYTLTRSPQADAISQARTALSEDYGLTSETIGLFDITAEQEGNTWSVTFLAAGFYPPLLGDYTVTLAPGKDPETHWTHDDVDPALWQDGSLDAPVWGQPQMLKSLQDKEALAVVQGRMDWSTVVRPTTSATQTPPPLKEGESLWHGQILRKATPGTDDIPQDQALELARQALLEDTSLTKEALDTAEVFPAEFYERDTGNPIWGFRFYVVDGGIEQDCAVMIDARTGEILLTNIITGANG